MEIAYAKVGDYLLPDLMLSETPSLYDCGKPLGKYACMRKEYLQEHRLQVVALEVGLFVHQVCFCSKVE